MAGARFIQHRGKKILHMDFAYSKFEEVLSAINQSSELVKNEPKGSVLGLVDVRKSAFNKDVAQALKELAAANTPYIKMSVVVGIDGIKAVIFNAVLVFTQRKNLITMDDIEKAKDFLAAQ
jgi:hypothetical protein